MSHDQLRLAHQLTQRSGHWQAFARLIRGLNGQPSVAGNCHTRLVRSKPKRTIQNTEGIRDPKARLMGEIDSDREAAHLGPAEEQACTTPIKTSGPRKRQNAVQDSRHLRLTQTKVASATAALGIAPAQGNVLAQLRRHSQATVQTIEDTPPQHGERCDDLGLPELHGGTSQGTTPVHSGSANVPVHLLTRILEFVLPCGYPSTLGRRLAVYRTVAAWKTAQRRTAIFRNMLNHTANIIGSDREQVSVWARTLVHEAATIERHMQENYLSFWWARLPTRVQSAQRVLNTTEDHWHTEADICAAVSQLYSEEMAFAGRLFTYQHTQIQHDNAVEMRIRLISHGWRLACEHTPANICERGTLIYNTYRFAKCQCPVRTEILSMLQETCAEAVSILQLPYIPAPLQHSLQSLRWTCLQQAWCPSCQSYDATVHTWTQLILGAGCDDQEDRADLDGLGLYTLGELRTVPPEPYQRSESVTQVLTIAGELMAGGADRMQDTAGTELCGGSRHETINKIFAWPPTEAVRLTIIGRIVTLTSGWEAQVLLLPWKQLATLTVQGRDVQPVIHTQFGLRAAPNNL